MNGYLVFEHVDFGYDGHPILKDFSLCVERGEHIGIKGPSGTGKTTLFRLILGFEQPAAGRIVLNGTPVTVGNYSAIRQTTAWLPQDLDIGAARVDDVLLEPFGFAANRGERPSEQRINETLSQLGLRPDIRTAFFEKLSTGQRQRVGLALCLLLDRPLLLLDEPTSALDEASKENVADLLLSDKERTIISTSHDPFWLAQCDRICSIGTVKK